MRSGQFDRLVTFTRPGGPERAGRSRVDGARVTVAQDVPARIEAGIGVERFASSEQAASAPFVIRVRREPDLDTLDAGDAAQDDAGRTYDIKSVRPDPRDPRRALEIAAVAEGAGA